MSQYQMDKVLELILTDKDYKKKLKAMGVSQQELDEFIKEILNKPERSYHRILAEDERRVITSDAFGYLINLLIIGSIDSMMLEKTITICMQLSAILKRKIDKTMIDEIVNYIFFTEQKEVSLRELVDLFYQDNSEYDFDEEVN